MPAKEDTYRNQHALHIVFAVSSIAMFASITWMIVVDHFREWKNVQRDFVKFDAAKTEKDSKDAKLWASDEEIAQLEEQLAAAKEQAAADVEAAQKEIDEIIGSSQKKEQELSFFKADRDSIASLIDIEKEKGDVDAVQKLETKLAELDAKIEVVRRESEDLQDTIDAAKNRIAAVNASTKVTDLEKEIANKEKERDRVEQKQWGIRAALRSSPVLDAFAPAVKIEQLVLSDLPIHYSFKGVPRFDRCTTCHKGIDSVTKEGGPAFDAKTVEEFSTSEYREAFKTHPHPELFAGPNSPHPREKFGCSICHLGQGSGTSFVYASHTPNDAKKLEEWKEQYGWYEIHHWPWKMNKTRFTGSGCLKCHPHVVDLDSPKTADSPATQKVVRGYNIVREYGCFGCHEINGWKNAQLIGPDLRLEPQTEEEKKKAAADLMNPPGRMRKVGPSLRHIAEKVQADWAYRWVKLPKGFRPTTRMPQFYGLTNNSGAVPGSDRSDIARSDVELHAIVHYLYSNSVKSDLKDIPNGISVDPTSAEQVARGKGRFIERGCLACHTHREIKEQFPQATEDFGPDLSNVAVKLKNADGSPNTRWLFNWLKNPLEYHATSFMPNLQLKDDEAADIAAWLLSAEGSWVTDPGQPALDEKVLDELITLFLQKSMTLKKTKEALSNGVPEEDAKEMKGDEKILVAPISNEKKLTYLGKKTISRMGCFGCHDIPGFETSKPIGTELASWGVKARMDPDKLDFAHITEYLHKHATEQEHHDPDFHLFLEGMEHHKGESFLWQKLRDPRSYDFNKLKAWDDKLRMPRFPFADNPDDVEAVMTFILGLVADDQIPQHYRNVPKAGPKFAMIEGERALTKFNCRGCHMTQMTEFTFDLSKATLPSASAQHSLDLPNTADDQKALTTRKVKEGAKTATISAMLVGAEPNDIERSGEVPSDAEVLAFDLWEPIEIAGEQFFIGDRFNIETAAISKDGYHPARGGGFAELLVSHLMRQDNKKLRDVWGFVPPPLVREGMKAQPAWLHQFLLNPTEIRPSVRLRMPKFNMTDAEAAHLAAYFAAVDSAAYPYEHIQQRDSDYIARMDDRHPNYLKDGWSLLLFEPKGEVQASQKLCAGCHQVADKAPSGGSSDERGPNLLLTPDRLRPEYLRQWLTRPNRLLPYTIMPQNFSKATEEQFSSFFKGTSQEQITAVRDALMNYHQVLQTELTERSSAKPSTGGN
jgi:cytochrome c551/c552